MPLIFLLLAGIIHRLSARHVVPKQSPRIDGCSPTLYRPSITRKLVIVMTWVVGKESEAQSIILVHRLATSVIRGRFALIGGAFWDLVCAPFCRDTTIFNIDALLIGKTHATASSIINMECGSPFVLSVSSVAPWSFPRW